MEYLALIHSDPDEWATLTDEERSATMAAYGALAEAARGAGVFVDGDPLAPVSAATTVRVRDGNAVVSDGPYAEVKESLGGFFLFDCESFEDAVAWAARIPAASRGAVEVRPVHVEQEA
jgi:hypothetical protein